jgi:hypothetical protein
MAYSLHFSIRDEALQAIVSGEVNPVTAGWVARDIADQASAQLAKAVLIDLRGLDDPMDRLCTMLLVAGGALRASDCRVAVLHVPRSKTERALPSFHYFNDPEAARNWLRDGRPARKGRRADGSSLHDDRNPPKPGSAGRAARYANSAA